MARRKKNDLEMKLDEMVVKENALEKAENEKFAALTEDVCDSLELFQLIEYVNQLTEMSKLSSKKLAKGKVLLECTAKRLGLSVNECVMIAVVIEITGTAELDEISSHFGCSNVKVMMMRKHLNSLVEKRWLNYVNSFRREGYEVRDEPLDSLYRNETYTCKDICDLTAENLLSKTDVACRSRFDNDISEDVYRAEVLAMLKYNPDIPFVKKLKEMQLE